MCDVDRACEREDHHRGLHMSRHLDETGSEVIDEWGSLPTPYTPWLDHQMNRSIETLPSDFFPNGYAVAGEPTDVCNDDGEVDRRWHRRQACRAKHARNRRS